LTAQQNDQKIDASSNCSRFVIANEGEAIQLMFGCSCDCPTRVLNQPARPSPDTSWIASLSLAMTVDDWVSYRSDAFHNLASPVMELGCALCV
jgi:hypothetical protein